LFSLPTPVPPPCSSQGSRRASSYWLRDLRKNSFFLRSLPPFSLIWWCLAKFFVATEHLLFFFPSGSETKPSFVSPSRPQAFLRDPPFMTTREGLVLSTLPFLTWLPSGFLVCFLLFPPPWATLTRGQGRLLPPGVVAPFICCPPYATSPAGPNGPTRILIVHLRFRLSFP